jgi:hypothetical protein
VTYFIIEHPTRGVLVELDPGARAGGRFSPTKRRSEALRFPSKGAAGVALAGLRTPLPCRVRESPRFTIVHYERRRP